MAKTFGDWTVIEQLGEGGQGHVLKVRHADGRIGALKRLKNPKRLDRFKNEIEACSRLNHPNIVPLWDSNIEAEPYYAVFKFVDGCSLQELGETSLPSIPLHQRLSLAIQIASALEHAHAVGPIHRDIKPENIIVSREQDLAFLCDFGLVYFDSEGERVTASMEQVGSRYYIAPESEDGRSEEISAATDLYSLGKVLYFLASGGNIFARERHRDTKYDLARTSGDPYTEAISELLDKVVIDDVSNRLPTASEFKNHLTEAATRIKERLPLPGARDTYRCLFCGSGKYVEIGNTTDCMNTGYNDTNYGGQAFVYLECDECGNAQRFRLKTGGRGWFPDTVEKINQREGRNSY